jgi:hypothetical protein
LLLGKESDGNARAWFDELSVLHAP